MRTSRRSLLKGFDLTSTKGSDPLSKIKWLSVLFVATALLLCACSQKEQNEPVQEADTNASVEHQQQETEADIQTEIPAPEPQITFVNPLTGLETQSDLTNKRPVTIMINNLYNALPQVGISEADIVYEILEEGGITRLLCVYNDFSAIPEIGSVRSTRDYYIDIADAHDAILVHAGGSTYAYSDLESRRTNNIDGLYAPQFYRSAERRKTMSREHTLMISGSGLDEAIAMKGFRTTSDSPSPLSFDSGYAKGEIPANHISFPFSIGYNSRPYITAFFDYNKELGEYLKGQFDMPHIDGDDSSQLSFKNVITLTCPMNVIKGDALGCIQVHFTGTGTGTYSVDGTHREIVWKKQSRGSAYTLYESDGETPLTLAPGKSYIALVPTGTSITLS